MNDTDAIDLKRLVMLLRRQIWFIAAIIGIFCGTAVTYVVLSTPKYTAKTSIIMDKSFTSALSDLSAVKKRAFDTAAIQSEVEVLKSRRVTELVVDKLVSDGRIDSADVNKAEKQHIINHFIESLNVQRAGETYVLNISFTSEDPQLAADIANTYAEAYITDQLNASAETSTRTFSWLDSKADDIKKQLEAAQAKVNKYRYNYNLQREGERAGKTESKGTYTLNELLNLEKDVESLGELLNSYIEKREEMSVQTSFPVTETRIISFATAPIEPSHPKKALIIGAATILAAGLGFLLAIMRDFFDRGLRRAGQITNEIAVPFLGFFPKTSKRAIKIFEFKTPKGEECGVSLHAACAENEFSIYAETIRATKNHIDKKLSNVPTKFIGVVSTTPREGSSEIASNLAIYAGITGNETLLIDGNFRRVTNIRAKKKEVSIEGLAGVFLHGKAIREVVLYNDLLNLSLLPSLAYEAEEVLRSLDTLKVNSFTSRCKNNFQYVFIDLPPLMATADLCFYAQALDGFVLVTEWGKTLSNSVNFYIQQNQIPKEKILGAILNRSNMNKMTKFYGHQLYSR